MGRSKAKSAIKLSAKNQIKWNKKVNKTDSCWLWLGGLTSKGYGSFRVGPTYVERAHVASYLMHKGDIAEGLQVRHICPGDTHYRHCVNPDHLVLGTAKDNGADKAALGTFKGVMSGEKNPMVKLSDDQVLEIHGRVHAGEAASTLGQEFDVTPRQIRMIRDGHTRKHLGLPVKPIVQRGANKNKRATRRGVTDPPASDEVDRFKKYYTEGPDCWEWTGCLDNKNATIPYGTFSFRGKNVGAHIISYLIANGSVPTGLDIAHKCANSLCVNPEHLWARTREQNMANETTRKRLSESKKGNRNRAVLSDTQIRKIKETIRDEPTVTNPELVVRFQLPVGPAAVARIRKGQTGVHIAVEGFAPQVRGKAYADRAVVGEAARLHDEEDMTQKQIAVALGRSQSGVRKLLVKGGAELRSKGYKSPVEMARENPYYER